MNKKKKLLITLVLGVLVILVLALIKMSATNFELSLKSNHCKDNLYLINQDLEALSQILNIKQFNFDDFKSLPDSLLINYEVIEETKTVRFTLIRISFDEKGRITNIQH